MGYGGEIKNSGEVTQYSNDNGIDGIIKEDVLGFGRIYIQAKRYQRDNKIGREDLNKFVGALAVAQSNKGVFITTSSFNKNAIEYASKLNNNTTLVLIDGEQLAKYINCHAWFGHFEFQGFYLTGYNTKLEHGPSHASFKNVKKIFSVIFIKDKLLIMFVILAIHSQWILVI